MEKEVSLSVKCPLCDSSFMDERHPICGKPSVKVNIETEHDRGVLRLCCIYGNCSKTTDVIMDEGEIAAVFCPHCNKELSIWGMHMSHTLNRFIINRFMQSSLFN
jgi:endogenous inhibitor of DNA gyrase (YacG/DUF329 family)